MKNRLNNKKGDLWIKQDFESQAKKKKKKY